MVIFLPVSVYRVVSYIACLCRVRESKKIGNEGSGALQGNRVRGVEGEKVQNGKPAASRDSGNITEGKDVGEKGITCRRRGTLSM